MNEVKDRIQQLLDEKSTINSDSMKLTAVIWSEQDWEEVNNRLKEISDELKFLIPNEISNLEKEKATLQKEYLTFGKKCMHFFTGCLVEVTNAQKRCIEIDKEIFILGKHLK